MIIKEYPHYKKKNNTTKLYVIFLEKSCTALCVIGAISGSSHPWVTSTCESKNTSISEADRCIPTSLALIRPCLCLSRISCTLEVPPPFDEKCVKIYRSNLLFKWRRSDASSIKIISDKKTSGVRSTMEWMVRKSVDHACKRWWRLFFRFTKNLKMFK